MEQPGVRTQAQEVSRGLMRGQGGYELVLTPLVLALAGLWVDRRLEITPALTVLGAFVGFVTVFVVMFYGYRNDMAHFQASRPAVARPESIEPDDGSSPWIERDLGDLEIPLPAALQQVAP